MIGRGDRPLDILSVGYEDEVVAFCRQVNSVLIGTLRICAARGRRNLFVFDSLY